MWNPSKPFYPEELAGQKLQNFSKGKNDPYYKIFYGPIFVF